MSNIQLRAILIIARTKGLDPIDVNKLCFGIEGVPIEALTAEQASEFIRYLQSL